MFIVSLERKLDFEKLWRHPLDLRCEKKIYDFSRRANLILVFIYEFICDFFRGLKFNDFTFLEELMF